MTNPAISKFMADNARKGHKVTYAKRYAIIEELRKFTTKRELDYFADRKNEYTTYDLALIVEVYKRIAK